MAGASAAALAMPWSPLHHLWRVNPRAHAGFLAMGPWAFVLLPALSAACAVAAVGLWVRAEWGRRTALALLVANFIGDGINAVVRGDLRTLIGLPVAAGLIVYLSSARVKAYCESRGGNR